MMSLVFDNTIFKILTVFSLAPGKPFTREKIKEMTKTNNVPLDDALRKLIISKMLIKKNKKYEIRHSAEWTTKLLEFITHEHWKLKHIPLDVYFTITDLLRKLSKHKCNVHLFGSYSKLTFTTDSDIDIVVVSDTPIDFKFTRALEKKYSKEIQIHKFSPDFYEKQNDPFVKEVLEGVALMKTLKK
ncbi:MAG: nucleotidyltransferase domain-containing protein [Candidatus Altiarchaeota archaeon]|nr:nucleotidyltransferase domain-containing protein [Candidatus Altiarchaeota archaeon]